jgi:hypothetical protein
VVADYPRAVVTAMYINLDTDMMGYSGSINDPLGPMPEMVWEYLARNLIDTGQAVVPIRPQRLRPGETGILVLTIEVPHPEVWLTFGTEMQWGEPPPAPR